MFGAKRNEERDIRNVDTRTGGPWRPHSEEFCNLSDLSRLFLLPSLLFPELRPQCKYRRSGNTLLRLCSDTMTPPGVTWHIQSPGCLKDTWFFLWQRGYPKPPKTWLQRRESQPLASVHTRSSQVTWIWVRRESCPSGAERITACLTIRIHRAMVFNPGLGIRVTWRALKTQMFRAVLDLLRTSGVAPGNT